MDTRSPSLPKTQMQRNRTTILDLALSTDLWNWLPHVTIVSTILIAAIVFLWPSPFEFPMDDSYIHLVYAENLSEHGGLFFNDPSENGVGSS